MPESLPTLESQRNPIRRKLQTNSLFSLGYIHSLFPSPPLPALRQGRLPRHHTSGIGATVPSSASPTRRPLRQRQKCFRRSARPGPPPVRLPRRVQTVALFPGFIYPDHLFSTRSVALFRKKIFPCALSPRCPASR